LADALRISLDQLQLLTMTDHDAEFPDHQVAATFSLYESLVGGAGAISVMEKALVPALFQTPEYAAEIELHTPEPVTDAQRMARVRTRMKRQEVLKREVGAVQVTCLLTEAVLLADVGGPGVMTDQLHHLVEVADHPSVVLRLLPHDGRDAAVPSGFQVFYRSHEPRPFLVVTFDVDQPRYIEVASTVSMYTKMFDYLAARALSPAETLARITEIADQRINRGDTP
jgi:hypothetical protein